MTAPSPRKKQEPVIIIPPEEMTGQIRNRLPVVEEGLRVLDPRRTDVETHISRFDAKRVPYAPMRAHMEMAAQVLAVGGTFKMAAARAGVSQRQIKKYYQDEMFRKRIQELRDVMLSKVRGRVMRELGRRTEDEKLQKLEFLDFLRLFDRVAGAQSPGGKAAVNVEINNQQMSNYDTLLAALISPDPGTEGEDFPILQLEGPSVSEGDS